MLHLENFFEKSFALLLTTPIIQKNGRNRMTVARLRAILRLVSKG